MSRWIVPGLVHGGQIVLFRRLEFVVPKIDWIFFFGTVIKEMEFILDCRPFSITGEWRKSATQIFTDTSHLANLELMRSNESVDRKVLHGVQGVVCSSHITPTIENQGVRAYLTPFIFRRLHTICTQLSFIRPKWSINKLLKNGFFWIENIIV